MGWIKITDLESGKILKTYGTVETNEVSVSTWTDPETKDPRSEISLNNVIDLPEYSDALSRCKSELPKK